MFRSPRRLSLIAAAIFVAWMGAVHHDIWFALADVAHSHEAAHSHHEPHDHHREGGDDEEGGGSPLILPNIHGVPFVMGGVPLAAVAKTLPPGGLSPFAAMWEGEPDLRGLDCANAPPPDWGRSMGKGTAALPLIRHCVQSNAPPSQV